jgi:hypothetical protein
MGTQEHSMVALPAYFFAFFIIIIWFVRLSWPIVPASGDSEDDCGEADGM